MNSDLRTRETLPRSNYSQYQNATYCWADGDLIDQDPEFEAVGMNRPMSRLRLFSLFGLMLGSAVPASLFTLFILRRGSKELPLFVPLLMTSSICLSSLVGYQFGKVAGAAVEKFDHLSFSKRTLAMAGLGFAWGGLAGAAGGVPLFLIGAFFGAWIGGITGTAAMLFFWFPYQGTKQGAFLEFRHFLPLTMGVTAVICGYILGFLIR